MLMNFEKYIYEDYELARDFENHVAYPSLFELICLLPLSKKSSSVETPSSIDDSII